jgi:hypothetical protein
VETPHKTDDEVILRAQLKLLELRRQNGIPVDIGTVKRTIYLEKRVLKSRRKKAA